MLYIGTIVILMLLILGVASGSGNNTSGVVGVAYAGWTEYSVPTTPATRITAYPLLPSCPSGCTCMGAKNAYNQGRVPCPSGSADVVCGVNQLGEEMHCYSDSIPTTTTATQAPTTLITTPITPIPSIPPASGAVTPSVAVTTIAPVVPSQQEGATVALSSCGSECRCILPDAATALGLPLCGGNPALCSYDASGKAMYCYALAQQAAMTGSGTAANTPALSSCLGDCSCLDPVTAGQLGLTLCNGTPTLCNYDANRNPMYCYSRASVTQSVPGSNSKSGKSIPVGIFTPIGAVVTVLMIAGFHSMKKNR